MLGLKVNMLLNYIRADKLYQKLCMDALSSYGSFTANEVLVLMFLTNPDNAPMDTATDIAFYRNMSKGMIAKSVESLTGRGYLEQERDRVDRRIVHLKLTGESRPLADCLLGCRNAFLGRMGQGMTEEDQKAFQRVSRIFEENVGKMAEQYEERDRGVKAGICRKVREDD